MSDHVEAAAVAHAHDKFRAAEAGAGIENFIYQGDQRSDAFEREALAAEVTLLHDLLENIRTDKQVKNALLIWLRRLGFHLRVDPAAAFGGVDVVDFDANGRGVDGAGFAGVLAFDLQLRSGARPQKAEGIEVAFKISPLTKSAEHAFALRVGAIVGRRLDHGGAGGLRFWGSHREFVTRIKDARRDREIRVMEN